MAGFGGMQPADHPTAEYRVGDVHQGFRGADKVLEGGYVTGIQCHVPIEMHCDTAWRRGDRLTIWDSQQSVFHAREILAQALGMPAENVRVAAHSLPRSRSLSRYLYAATPVTRSPITSVWMCSVPS